MGKFIGLKYESNINHKAMEFQDFKNEFAKRAKENNACLSEYKRLLECTDFGALFQVIKDNFKWCCGNKTIDPEFLGKVKEEANTHDVWFNENVKNGYLLVENSSVEARGNAYVEARGNVYVVAMGNSSVVAMGSSSVEAMENSSVVARGNAYVVAMGNSSVEARENAYVTAKSTMECKISNYAIMRYRDKNQLVICKGKLEIIEVE